MALLEASLSLHFPKAGAGGREYSAVSESSEKLLVFTLLALPFLYPCLGPHISDDLSMDT